METNGAHKSESSLAQVELGYCPRCGTLRVFVAGAAAELCPACCKTLEWIRSGLSRPRRGRPRRVCAKKGGRR